LAEVLNISVDVIGGEAFEGISLLVQIREELPDVPASVLARCQRQPTSLTLYLYEVFNPRLIGAWGRIRIVSQAAQPIQEVASNGAELLLGPARSGGPSLCHASRCPRSSDGLEVCITEAMVSRPVLDLTGDA
jgi:hypothetical protein